MSGLRRVKRILFFFLLAVALGFCAAVALYFTGGVTHRDLRDSIESEHARTRAGVDSRADAIDRRLDRIESKLDRLLELATPHLPDGMSEAK